MSYRTLDLDCKDGVASVRFNREASGHPINAGFIQDLGDVVGLCEDKDGPSLLVLCGSPSVFCLGGDFQGVGPDSAPEDPAPLYDLWLRLASGPFISIAVVEGKANAGGVGLAAACDIVLAGSNASFSLSELLFGLFPACVHPFLVRRVGFQRAHYMTLSTQPISAQQALQWGLADALEDPVEGLLRKHLLRLRRISKQAVGNYKEHAARTLGMLQECRSAALDANRAMFADPMIRDGISRYVAEGKFPWES
jgi:polyketide biosynthesis enoyl-CoA hydratase PksH